MSSLNSLNATLEEAATTRQEEVNKMEQLMAKFKEEREQLISQVRSSAFPSFSREKQVGGSACPLGLKLLCAVPVVACGGSCSGSGRLQGTD